MANRLTRITTRTGDAGTTGLADGSRVAKDAPRIAALGEVDELNSLLGVILCEDMPIEARELLIGIQHDLFDLGGELAVPGASFLKTQLQRIELAVERTTASFRRSRNSSCPAAAAPLRWRIWRAPSAGAPNAQWSPSATANRYRTRRASTSIDCLTCCSCSAAGSTSRPAAATRSGRRARTPET
jgi:cob(I)alamin adenosyltransferase